VFIIADYFVLFILRKFNKPINNYFIMNKKVGIVLPLFNGKKYISESIDSLLGQKYKNFIIVVVDDGSTDKSFEDLQKKYKGEIKIIKNTINGKTTKINPKGKIILIRQKNKHISGARNTGLKILFKIGCDYYTLQDHDDIALKNKLSDLVSYLEKNPSIGLVHAKARDIDSKGKIIKNGPYQKYFQPLWKKAKEKKFKKGDLYDIGYISNQTIMFRKKVIEKLGVNNLYPEKLKYTEDWVFNNKVERAGFKIGFLDKYVSKYRLHQENTTGLIKETKTVNQLIKNVKNEQDIGEKLRLFHLLEMKLGREKLIENKELWHELGKAVEKLRKEYINPKI
jgi:GT2 family glycosyltransferase